MKTLPTSHLALRRACVLGTAAALAGCSILETDKIDYKSAGRAPTLDVPPDLSQLTRDNRYAVSGNGAVSASGFEARQAAPNPNAGTAPTAIGDVAIERDGNTRWLVVNRSPDQLWDPVRDFWLESGFLLAIDQSNLGIMETDWAENRAKLPQDIIRSTLGRLIDSVYSTAERDKFRTRMERRPDGKTEIFISHRGMQEVYVDRQRQEQTIWQPRPVDPELEAEFLRRLMVKLGGASVAQARQAAAAAPEVRSTVALQSVEGQPAVVLNEPFDRAWRRVGLTLDRTGFTVEDRDRSKGLYFVRYVAPDAQRAKQGFLGRLFNRNPDAAPPVRYRLLVRGQGDAATSVVVQDTAGAPVAGADAERILRVVADDLK